MEFDWNDANILHLKRHDITPQEAEQVVRRGTCFLEAQGVDGEVRTVEVGETSAGRILTLVMTQRGPLVRVATGWDATRSERLEYIRSLSQQADYGEL